MLTISTQANIAIRSLLPEDKVRIEHVLKLLDRFPQDEYIQAQAKQLPGFEFDDLYIMRVTSTLRLLFRYTQESIEILDVFTHDRLEKMYGQRHQSSA